MSQDNNSNNNENTGNTEKIKPSCPPIEVGLHQNSYKPSNNSEKRSKKYNE